MSTEMELDAVVIPLSVHLLSDLWVALPEQLISFSGQTEGQKPGRQQSTRVEPA